MPDTCLGGRGQIAKMMVSGKMDTRQLHEESETESVRMKTNEKEQKGGRGVIWKQRHTNVENIETT